jgi:hypothetical protein
MYRYSQLRYSKSLLTMGILRIGTLHDFRRIEHAKGIADPQEGKKEVSHHIRNLFVPTRDDPALQKNKDFQALAAFGVIKMSAEAANLTVENVTFSRAFDHPDCFVLCTSARLSRSTMAQFEGADSCVEIVDTVSFYQTLTNAINALSPVVLRGVFKVQYRDRQESWNGQDWGAHPALIKEKQFTDQHEIRALWQPRHGQHIEPLITGDYRLGRFCREVFP